MRKELIDKITEELRAEDWNSFVIVGQKPDGSIAFFKNGVSSSLMFGMATLMHNFAAQDMEELTQLLTASMKDSKKPSPKLQKVLKFKEEKI